MIVLEYKIKGKQHQYGAIDEAIRTGQFVRNKALRYWMDNKGVNKYDLNKYCAVLAKEFGFANKLNSTARQSSAERAWSGISRFYENCKKRRDPASPTGARERSTRQKIPGKKGYPKFKRFSRSVEYKKSGWKLDESSKKHITFTDKNKIGRVKLVGSRDIYYYQPEQIKRVRLVRRADGYYVQFGIAIEVKEDVQPAGRAIGLDMGLKYFYADSLGHTEANPRFYRKSEKRLNRLARRLSRKYRNLNKAQQRGLGGHMRLKPLSHERLLQEGKSGKLMTATEVEHAELNSAFPSVKNPKQRQSKNYHKARVAKAKQHLKVSRQRIEHAKKVARCVCASNDCIVYEDLKVRNLVRNRRLSKSINDVAWTQFRSWVEYFGWKFGKITIAVPPHYTSQDCPNCGARVKKALSTRTHVCECGYTEDRDIAAAINILKKGLNTLGHSGIYAWGDTPSWAVGANLPLKGESLN